MYTPSEPWFLVLWISSSVFRFFPSLRCSLDYTARLSFRLRPEFSETLWERQRGFRVMVLWGMNHCGVIFGVFFIDWDPTYILIYI